ncbi:hypothetical protein AMJ80_05290 [bacterium SM23_31]|nr:MAG: hypothetical protein AMJ80_05290 [bacterium SM23_31]
MNRRIVITTLAAFALVVFFVKKDVYSQELSTGVNLAIYNQNDHLDDGGGYEAFANFKINRFPFVLRLMFCQYWANPIPRQLPETNKETMGYSFEPSLLLRFDYGTRPDLGPVLQPYIGVAYGFHEFPRTVDYDDSLIIRKDKLQSAKSPVLILGTNVTFTPRLSLNLNLRYALIKPDVKSTIQNRASGAVGETAYKIELRALYFSIGLRFHIFKNPRFR